MSSACPSQRPYRRFMRWFWLLLGGYFLITALLSLIVNPWRINRTPLSLNLLDDARDISKCLRVGKAGLAISGDWEVGFFGSSRVEQAFDPEHPALDGKKTVNLGMAAAGLYETIPACHYALDHNPDLKLIFFGIDAGDLHSDIDSRAFTRFSESPLSGNLSLESKINQVVGGRSFLDSIGTIQRYISGELPDRTRHGQCIDPDIPHNLRKYTEYAFSRGFERGRAGWEIKNSDLNDQKSELLKSLLIRARENGVKMHVFVPIQHALKIVHPALDRPAEMCWEIDLKGLTRICDDVNRMDMPGPPITCWSFLTFSSLNNLAVPAATEGKTEMLGWYDLGHAHEEIGSSLLETMLGTGDKEFGTVLTLDNWVQIRNQWIDQHQQYCLMREDDVEWWRMLIRNSGSADGKLGNASHDLDR